TRLYGGTIVYGSQYPYLVSIQFNRGHRCGGSIISERFVLTAAHCIIGLKLKHLHIVVGTNSLDAGGIVYETQEVIIYPRYHPLRAIHDIALIKVAQDFSFDRNILPIELINTDAGLDNVTAVVAGWGNVSRDLRQLNVSTIKWDKCAMHVNWVDEYDAIMCTSAGVGYGACFGDSGSPLTYNYKQIGIVSRGKGCANGEPDINTKVSYYIQWINS
ncbi:unnamed protein product, partial [Sphagnum compactum]